MWTTLMLCFLVSVFLFYGLLCFTVHLPCFFFYIFFWCRCLVLILLFSLFCFCLVWANDLRLSNSTAWLNGPSTVTRSVGLSVETGRDGACVRTIWMSSVYMWFEFWVICFSLFIFCIVIVNMWNTYALLVSLQPWVFTRVAEIRTVPFINSASRGYCVTTIGVIRSFSVCLIKCIFINLEPPLCSLQQWACVSLCFAYVKTIFPWVKFPSWHSRIFYNLSSCIKKFPFTPSHFCGA